MESKSCTADRISITISKVIVIWLTLDDLETSNKLTSIVSYIGITVSTSASIRSWIAFCHIFVQFVSNDRATTDTCVFRVSTIIIPLTEFIVLLKAKKGARGTVVVNLSTDGFIVAEVVTKTDGAKDLVIVGVNEGNEEMMSLGTFDGIYDGDSAGNHWFIKDSL